MITLVMFLSGVGLGGALVWALVSYTPLSPVSSALPENAVPVQRIFARLEREGLKTARSSVAGAAGRRSGAGPRPMSVLNSAARPSIHEVAAVRATDF
ncbi:hypothetical protein [Nocardia sp. IFM 10818]